MDLSQYIGKKIQSINIAMIAHNYLEYIEAKTWLSDVGIEFTFDDDTVASVFYDENTDSFGLYERTLTEHLDGVDHYLIDLENNEFIDSLSEKIITKFEVKNQEIVTHDYKGEILDSSNLPVEYLIEFDDETKIQVASVTIKLRAEESEIASIYYNPEGNIWIAFDEVFEIV